MKAFIILGLALLCLLSACLESQTTSSAGMSGSDSVLAQRGGDTLPSPVDSLEAPSPACPFDEAAYRFHTGKGVMVLRTRPGDSLVFYRTPNQEGDSLILRHLGDYGWYLRVEGIEKYIFSPFKWANNYEHYEFLWLEENSATGSHRVLLNEEDRNLWLARRDNSKVYFIPWERYLKHQRIFLEPGSPIHTSPAENTPVRDYPELFFYVLEIQGPWIGIAPIYRDQPSAHLDTMQMYGWAKWFCADTFQIRMLNDLHMEEYFLE